MEELDFEMPSPWPHRIAMIFGLLCFVLAVWTLTEYFSTGDDRQEVLAQLEVPLTPGDLAQETKAESLRQSYKALSLERTLWARRALGLGIAGLILFFGGYLCAGFRHLHEGLKWQVIDDAEDAKTRDDPLIFKPESD
ncbi:MAG: hypothetical protein CMH60_04870 [Myxococcales bacterium]|nr:hypothetical protein [Myxococcales bacterium]|tara:strand:+ start:247 stop:660 length:414 start_codon:yes stop_codon:yes gene_type:complete